MSAVAEKARRKPPARPNSCKSAFCWHLSRTFAARFQVLSAQAPCSSNKCTIRSDARGSTEVHLPVGVSAARQRSLRGESPRMRAASKMIS